MTAMQTGLLHRVKRVVRQIKDQHRHLGAIRAELARAFDPGDRARVMVAWHSYREAIAAHFALENETFFPALHGLRPEFAGELEALDREHATLLTEFDPIEEALVRGALDSGSLGIRSFDAELARHERREEALMARIMGVLPAAAEIDANAT